MARNSGWEVCFYTDWKKMKIDLTQKEKDRIIHLSRVMGDMYNEEKIKKIVLEERKTK